MKKILSLSPSSVLIACGIGLVLTLGGFWHHQNNLTHLNRMSVLNQGVGTCFNRISQTFTAMMIKDVQSAYLNRGFMGLSDECLNETIKGINPFRQNVGKGYETLNKLISEVHWFHEKVLKIHAPLLAGQPTEGTRELADKFTKMEALKVTLVDEIDAANARYSEILKNDEILMGLGLLMFVIGLSILSMQEFNRIQLKREIEKNALNLLKSGQANVGALVDQLIESALRSQGMIVSSQVFKDYHGDMLERSSVKFAAAQDKKEFEAKKEEKVVDTEVETDVPNTSLKELLVSLQNVHSKEMLHITEVRDVRLAVPFEATEQMMNAVINKLFSKNIEKKKIMISNQIHSDRSLINFFLGGGSFNASELEEASGIENADVRDMNMLILKEMIKEVGADWHIENKTDRQGRVTGMNIRLILKRAPREKTKLVSVMKGKKKELARELMN